MLLKKSSNTCKVGEPIDYNTTNGQFYTGVSPVERSWNLNIIVQFSSSQEFALKEDTLFRQETIFNTDLAVTNSIYNSQNTTDILSEDLSSQRTVPCHISCLP